QSILLAINLPGLTCELRTISQFHEVRQDKWGKPPGEEETFSQTNATRETVLAVSPPNKPPQ
ncbi:MAG: hypothetical protein VB857_10675, partial [Pirellulaceae bacterium]